MTKPPCEHGAHDQNADDGQQQRADDMKRDAEHAPEPFAAQQQRRYFGGERGERRQASQETRGHQETQFRSEQRMPRHELHREAHHQAADEICGQRAERQRGKHGVEHRAETPAQPCPDGGAPADGQP